MPEGKHFVAGSVLGNVFYVAGGTTVSTSINSRIGPGNKTVWAYAITLDRWATGEILARGPPPASSRTWQCGCEGVAPQRACATAPRGFVCFGCSDADADGPAGRLPRHERRQHVLRRRLERAHRRPSARHHAFLVRRERLHA